MRGWAGRSVSLHAEQTKNCTDASLRRAGLGAPASGVGEFLEVGGGDEGQGQVLRVADFGGDHQPLVSVGTFDAVVVFREGRHRLDQLFREGC